MPPKYKGFKLSKLILPGVRENFTLMILANVKSNALEAVPTQTDMSHSSFANCYGFWRI